MSKSWALRILRWAYVAFIAVASGAAIRSALSGAGDGRHPAHLVLILAVPELIAALALLAPPVELFACVMLVVIYIAASMVSVASGDVVAPLRFFYYAATAIFLVATERGQSLNAPSPSRPASDSAGTGRPGSPG